jgi:hypothetical protein
MYSFSSPSVSHIASSPAAQPGQHGPDDLSGAGKLNCLEFDEHGVIKSLKTTAAYSLNALRAQVLGQLSLELTHSGHTMSGSTMC